MLDLLRSLGVEDDMIRFDKFSIFDDSAPPGDGFVNHTMNYFGTNLEIILDFYASPIKKFGIFHYICIKI